MKRMHFQALALAAAMSLGFSCAGANAGVMDFLFGKRASESPAPADSSRRTWRVGEFTAVQIVPREAGSAPNAQPVSLHPEGLRQQLALVRAQLKGKQQPLFHADELKELAEPLSQALSVAGPNDDIVLLSTSRRGEGALSTPLGLTARLFAQGGQLNMIVHDTRRDFVNAYIGSHLAPQFEFGSRAAASTAVLQSAGAPNKRTDWIAIPIAATAPVTAPLAAPAAPVLQAVPVAAMPAPVAAPAAPPAAPARDAAFYEEQARRLKGLKLLRDQGAITEEEYQQKRKEILSGL